MLRYDAAPIAAIATAPGRGGIGIVRISGDDLQLFTKVLLRRELTPRQAYYLPFFDQDNNLVDQGVAIFFEAPHSYTGQDVLELQGHGGTAVLQSLLSSVLTQGKHIGLRLAEPGEFSMRAYLNSKIDLIQAEAVEDLINASSTQAAQAAAMSLSGRFSEEVSALIAEIVSLRTLVEATLDFPEEEIEFIEKYQVRKRIETLIVQFHAILLSTKQSVFLSDGLRVVLAGEPNVGKSSLMNAIFGENVAIVSEIAGTTRDSIKDNFHLDGVPITVTDTAGLRRTNDLVEQLGIDRSWAAIESSNVILDVVDTRYPRSVLSDFLSANLLADKIIICVFNKVDLAFNASRITCNKRQIYVSALTGEGLLELKQAILAQTGRQLGERSPWLARKRHVLAIEQGLLHLKQSLVFACQDDKVLDLLAEELRLCHEQLGYITGKMTADALLGEIFSNFCIGK